MSSTQNWLSSHPVWGQLLVKANTVQLRIFGTNFRPVETRNFASLPRFLGLTELYWGLSLLVDQRLGFYTKTMERLSDRFQCLYYNTVQLRKIVGWVKQSATQQSTKNVGFRSSTQPTQFKDFGIN
ncbi:hypothetical protein [Nostoc sphaeroides]|uniref:Uncharacterized protein n=1 Tax=Nostoc sphaeroides CCNUC1 TaxID=2653204 RepID=A0A5P8WBW6_9NOSO|nr:hypothetical protein [Nostoc sphaeroides]QFS50315.1 hypothetical protein GXM_07809 [Nostoc sphaeroides CCNUC1]